MCVYGVFFPPRDPEEWDHIVLPLKSLPSLRSLHQSRTFLVAFLGVSTEGSGRVCRAVTTACAVCESRAVWTPAASLSWMISSPWPLGRELGLAGVITSGLCVCVAQGVLFSQRGQDPALCAASREFAASLLSLSKGRVWILWELVHFTNRGCFEKKRLTYFKTL